MNKTPHGALDIAHHPSVSYLIHGDLVLILWYGEPSLEANKWLIDGIDRALSRSSLLLQFITPQSGMPGPEARRYVERVFREKLAIARQLVMAPLGDSIAKSMIRALFRAMVTVAGRSKVVTIVASVSEALDVVEAHHIADATPSRAEAFADVRALFKACGVTLDADAR